MSQATRTRGLRGLWLAAVVVLGLLIWVLWPTSLPDDRPAALGSQPDAPGALPSFSAPLQPAAPELVTASPLQPLVEENEPLAAQAAPTPAPAAPSALIDVGVITPDGESLEQQIDELLPDWRDLSIVATNQPPDWRLPDSVAPFYSDMGLGRFHRRSRGGANPEPTVAGFIGTLELPSRRAEYVSVSQGPIVLATLPLREWDESLLFVIDLAAVKQLGAELRLQVVDALTRDPIPGVGVLVGMYRSMLENQDGPQTGDDGRAELRDLQPGPTQLLLSGFNEGYEDRVLDLILPSRGLIDFGPIELQPMTRISGHVRFETGEPAAKAYVMAFLDDPSLASSMLCARLRTNTAGADGNFSIWRLGPRHYSLVVQAGVGDSDDWSQQRNALVPVDLTGGSVRGLVITVAQAATVTLRNPAGREGTSIHVRNEAAPGFDWWPDIPWLRSPDERRILLVPGRYVVELTVPGEPTLRRTIDAGLEPLVVDLGSDLSR